VDKSESKMAADIDGLKRLAIIDLTARGVKQKHIALALGVSEATLSTMFPKGLLRDVRGGGGRSNGEGE